MADENQNPEGGAQPEAGAEEVFTLTRSQLDAFKARAVDEHAKAQPAPADPLERYYQGTSSRARQAVKQPAQPQVSGSRTDELLGQLLALQVATLKPPAPPAPPKPMAVSEKLASSDPSIWLHRNSPNAWSASDREQLVQAHVSKLAAEGFRGNVEQEASARASREVVASARKAIGNIPVRVGGQYEVDPRERR